MLVMSSAFLNCPIGSISLPIWSQPCTKYSLNGRVHVKSPRKKVNVKKWTFISRSEQAPGSEFHPRDKSEKNYGGFLGPSWCNKKVNPETYFPCRSYELLLTNVANQTKEKLTIQNDFSHFLSQISMKFEICSFFSGSKQPEKKEFWEKL